MSTYQKARQNLVRAFHKYIKLRDPYCVTCQYMIRHELIGNKKYTPEPFPSIHASHYISCGNEGTRYDERNVHGQCAPCHIIYGGKKAGIYKLFMLETYGQELLDELVLLGNTQPRRSEAWLKEQAQIYRDKNRRLINA